MRAVVKILAVLALLLVVAIPAAAQDKFSVQGGLGHLWTGNGNYWYGVDTAQASVSLAFTYTPVKSFQLALEATYDTADVVTWMNEHEFTSKTAVPGAYNYFVMDLEARWLICPDGKLSGYLGVGPSLYRDTDGNTAGGVMAVVGVEYDLTKNLYAYVDVKYRHVQEFIVPVANVVHTGIGLGWRF